MTREHGFRRRKKCILHLSHQPKIDFGGWKNEVSFVVLSQTQAGLKSGKLFRFLGGAMSLLKILECHSMF